MHTIDNILIAHCKVESKFRWVSFNLVFILDNCRSTCDNPSGDCRLISPMVSYHWFRHLLCAVRQQTISWNYVDPRSMSPLGVTRPSRKGPKLPVQRRYGREIWQTTETDQNHSEPDRFIYQHYVFSLNIRKNVCRWLNEMNDYNWLIKTHLYLARALIDIMTNSRQ